MLSVKHVEKNGYESVRMARSVSFTPPSADLGDGWERGQLIAFGAPAMTEDGRDNIAQYSSGIVYVMNDSGSTVAKYDLD